MRLWLLKIWLLMQTRATGEVFCGLATGEVFCGLAQICSCHFDSVFILPPPPHSLALHPCSTLLNRHFQSSIREPATYPKWTKGVPVDRFLSALGERCCVCVCVCVCVSVHACVRACTVFMWVCATICNTHVHTTVTRHQLNTWYVEFLK